MRKISYSLIMAVAMILSLSVSASNIGEKAYTDPNFAMYAGFSGSIITESGFAEVAAISVIAADMEVPFMGITIDSLDKLKPDKTEQFTYKVIKPVKFAKMQNQNFDRVLVNYTY